MYYHKEYGILPRQMGRPLATDYYIANHRVSFERISEITGLSTDLISTFNPQFRRGIIPGNSMPYPVRLPLGAILKLDSASSEVSSPELRVQLEGPATTAPSTSRPSSEQSPTSSSEDETPVISRSRHNIKRGRTKKSQQGSSQVHSSTHAVRSGETLYSIAHRNGVTVQELKKANNLSSDKISVGQQIKLQKGNKKRKKK